MKIQILFSTTAAAAVLACTAGAQQLFGPWVHDSSVQQLSLFVSPGGGGTGNSSTSPTDIYTAVQTADILFGANWATTGKGVTINMLPGTYALPRTVSLPAFGFSIEPYFDNSGSAVTISGPLGVGNPLFNFDHVIGPITQLIVGNAIGMPGSTVRGLTFLTNDDAAINIDPSLANSADLAGTEPIQVEVTQCKIQFCSRGVFMQNVNAAQLEYRNLLVDNTVDSCVIGFWAKNAWYESDLIRSNRVSNTAVGMRFDGTNGATGMLHPRILSNIVGHATQGMGIELHDCSARVVNNTVAFITTPPNGTPSSILIQPDASGSAGESIVIANNLLFSPTYVIAGTLTIDPPEISVVGVPFAGSLKVESNDFDSSGTGTLISPVQPVGPGNIAIAAAQFASTTALTPGYLHLSATSPSITNQGNMAFVVPGTTATIKINSQVLPAHCALDVDLDPRTHMQSGNLTEVLHRGADEFIETGVRLTTATSGANPLLLADRFGNLRTDSSGNALVDLVVNVPTGSTFSIVLGATLPMGPELQAAQVSPFGSIAIDPSSPNGVTKTTVVNTPVSPFTLTLPLGQLSPSLNEAEMYLQAVVALPNGVIAPTNRLRIDIDGL